MPGRRWCNNMKMTTFIFKIGVFSASESAFSKIEKYIKDFLSILPEELGEIEDVTELLTPSAIFTEISAILKRNGGAIGGFFALLMISCVVAYIASLYEGRLSSSSQSAVCVIALSPAAFQLLDLSCEMAEGLDKICGFFSSLAPLMLSVMVAGGANNSSAASGLQMSLVASAVEALSSEILIPQVKATLILGAVSALGGAGADKLVSLFRNIFTKGVGIVSAVVCALFALQSLIAGAADTAALRLAKFTAQSLAPSVGAVIGASMSTLSSGLAYARSIIGAGAIAAILWIMLSPLALVMIYRLAVGLCLSFSGSLGVKPHARALQSMQYALDGLISVFLMSGVLFVMQIIIFIKCTSEI